MKRYEVRTDENNNPAAFTTAIAKQAGLVENVDYKQGTKFPSPSNLFTANLIGDPITLTIKVIDKVGYYTSTGAPRWTYIAIPKFIWDVLSEVQKRSIIAFHYKNEGGTAMKHLFVEGE